MVQVDKQVEENNTGRQTGGREQYRQTNRWKRIIQVDKQVEENNTGRQTGGREQYRQTKNRGDRKQYMQKNRSKIMQINR